jgi:hypothetical protein
MQPCDIHGSAQGHIGLSHGTEQSTVMQHPGDSVVHHDLSEMLVVQDIGINELATMEDMSRGFLYV